VGFANRLRGQSVEITIELEKETKLMLEYSAAVGLSTLRDIVTLRPPLRQAAMGLLLDMTTHAGMLRTIVGSIRVSYTSCFCRPQDPINRDQHRQKMGSRFQGNERYGFVFRKVNFFEAQAAFRFGRLKDRGRRGHVYLPASGTSSARQPRIGAAACRATLRVERSRASAT
jgi:hypothetical protein